MKIWEAKMWTGIVVVGVFIVLEIIFRTSVNSDLQSRMDKLDRNIYSLESRMDGVKRDIEDSIRKCRKNIKENIMPSAFKGRK